MENTSKKYFEGNASQDEQKQLLEWLRRKGNRAAFNNYKTEWRNSLKNDQFPGGGEESWNRLQANLWQKDFISLQNRKNIFMISKIAAIFFFLVSVGSLVYYNINESHQVPEKFSSVFTENGQLSKIQLSDGTLVWLNSGSEIQYSNHYASSNRNIRLTGEAYFDVTGNKELPMIIDCGSVKIKVRGTRFNINAYKTNNSIDVTLEDGEVELIESNSGNSFYNMKPGEKANVSTGTSKFSVNTVNTSRYTSWKDGIIHIYNLPLEQVVKQLEKRYNQKFELTPEITQIKYTFTIQNESLDEVINLIEKITPVKAEQKDNVIMLKGDNMKMRNTGR